MVLLMSNTSTAGYTNIMDTTNSLSLSDTRRRPSMKRRNNRSASLPRSSSCCYLFLVMAASLFLAFTGGGGGVTVASAYRMGDVVDTDIRLASGTSDALRSQMPQFGVSSKANFRFEDQQDDSFSLQFEDGLRGLPWVPLVNNRFKGQAGGGLEKLIVTFVYSKSGGGTIHTVLSEAVYQETAARRPQQAGSFQVQYVWVEEANVHLHAGQAVMFLAVFLASLYFICYSCGLVEGDGGGGGGGPRSNSDWNGGNDSWNVPQAAAGAVPKWD